MSTTIGGTKELFSIITSGMTHNNRDVYCSKWIWITRWTTVRRRSGWGKLAIPRITSEEEMFNPILHFKQQRDQDQYG
jgi:hypothetical protein